MIEANRAEIDGEAGFDLPGSLAETLERLLQYWQSLIPPEGGPPSKSRFDPLDLKGLWHDLSVLHFATGPDGTPDIMIRYAGEHLDSMHGVSLAGKRLLDVLNETEARRAVPCLMRAVAEGVPHYRRGVRPHDRQGALSFERLVVPFLSEDRRTSYLVGIWHWPQSNPKGVLRLGNGVHMISSKADGESGDQEPLEGIRSI